MEDGEPPQTLSLIPYEYVDAGKIADAIHRVAENWIQENKIPEAIRRFLLRLPPKIAVSVKKGVRDRFSYWCLPRKNDRREL